MFTQRDNAEMHIAADFRWVNKQQFLTLGVTPNLVATVHAEQLERVIDNIIARRIEHETDNDWLERQLEGR